MQHQQWPVFTCEDIIKQFPIDKWGTWINIGIPWIRPFTGEELKYPERFNKTDLEGGKIVPEAEKWLCKGDRDNYWTTGAEHVQKYRVLVNPNEPADAEGFRKYKIRDPKPILAIILFDPFILHRSENDLWYSQLEGGVITWNGEVGKKCDMRVNTIQIFDETYRRQLL